MQRFLAIIILVMWQCFIFIFATPVFAASSTEKEIETESDPSLEDIEQELTQDLKTEHNRKLKIERENLTSLEEKKKESESAEIELDRAASVFTYTNKARLIILNKITAKSEILEFKSGEPRFFGNVSVEVGRCALGQDAIKPSSLIFITVIDHKLESDAQTIFKGWMDSANLSISTLEHPVYDVLPIECIAR